MKKLSPLIAVVLLGVMVRAAGAQGCPAGPGGVPNVAITGALSTIYGAAAANQRVQYEWGMTQQPGSFITTTIPTSKCSVFTDANGNLPTPPAKCTCFPQGASGWLTIGSGEPAKIVFPPFTTANISDILPVNAAMDPIVSEIDLCGSPTDVAFAVSNPPIGTIGPATLCPGNVTGLQGFPICTTPPTINQVLTYNGTQWCPATTPGGGSGGPLNQCGTGGAGFGCDYNTDDVLTLTNGSTLVTQTTGDNPWTAADVGKLIRIDYPKNNFASREVFVGTIASFVDSSNIHLSSPYTGINVTGGSPNGACTALGLAGATPLKCCTGAGTGSCTDAVAMWGSAGDNTAWNNMMTAIGDTSIASRPAKFNCTRPILITDQLQIFKRSLDFAGSGITSLFDPAAGCAVIWMGTTDTTGNPMIRLTNDSDTQIHDFVMLGGTLHPPFAGVMGEQLSGQGAANSGNRIYNIKMGGLENLSLGPDESDGDHTTTLTGTVAAGSTSGAVTGPVDLYPGEAVRFYDGVAGDEVRHLTNAAWCKANGGPYSNCTGASTCPTCYVAGSTNLNWDTPTTVTHTAANTTVQWVSKPPLVTGISWGPQGTQNDNNYFDSVDVWGGVNSAFYSNRVDCTVSGGGCGASGINQAVNMHFDNVRARNFGIAFDWPHGGQFIAHNTQLLAGGGATGVNATTGIGAAGIPFYMGGSVAADVSLGGSELDGCTVPGVIWYLNGTGSSDVPSGGVSYFTSKSLQITNNGCARTFTGPDGNSYTPVIETGPDLGSWLNMDITDLQLLDGVSNPLAQNTQPTIYNFAQANSSITIRSLRSVSDHHQLQITDLGTARANISREYDIYQIPTQANTSKRWIQQVLRLVDRPIWQVQQFFGLQSRGGVIALKVKPPSPGTPTCCDSTHTCTISSTGRDYYFLETAVDGAGHETSPGSMVTKSCVAPGSLGSGADYLTVPGGSALGASAYNLYEADVAHLATAPAIGAFVEVQTLDGDMVANTPTGLSGSPPSFTYYAQAAIGGAPPTTNATGESDFTGTTTVPFPTGAGQALSAALSQGQSTVADAPGFAQYVISTYSPGAYYKMNEGSGNLTDSSGHGLTATANGAGITYSQAGTINQDPDTAISMPGTAGRYFSRSTNAALPSGDGPETWCLGLRLATSTSQGTLFSQGANGLSLRIATGQVLVEEKEGGANMFCAPGAIADTNNHYVCVAKDGADNQMVVDGTDVTAPCGGNVTLTPADGSFNIGADSAGSTNLNAVFDEVDVFKKRLPLNAMQAITSYWSSKKFGAWWWFEDGVPGTCPVTSSGNAITDGCSAGGNCCEALYQPSGWCCNGSLVPTPVPTSTPTPTPTATPAPTATPTGTATPTATPT